MFEDRTFDNIMRELLGAAPAGVDTRQGGIFYDAVAGVALKLEQYYFDLANIFDLVFLTTAVGEYLDRKGQELGVARNGARPARYKLLIEGASPPASSRFFTDEKYFTVLVDDGVLTLVAETPGAAASYIDPGTQAVPMDRVPGMTAASFGELIEPGADIETDDDYRQRIREKIAGPAENGNRQHYKTWCEQVAGVGRAHILPLWDGENTVKAVLFDPEGTPVTAAVVERVQDYIDPGGTGLGDGMANIGAHFTAEAAQPLTIDVAFDVSIVSGATVEQVKAEAAEAIRAYLRGIMLDSISSDGNVVRVSAIGALIHALPSVIDYTELMLNGAAANIEVGETQAAILGEVTVSEIV